MQSPVKKVANSKAFPVKIHVMSTGQSLQPAEC